MTPIDESPPSAATPDQSTRSSRFKRLSVLTLPLLVAAVLVELTILATGYMYQKDVNVPPGMKLLIFGITPMGALILAVELLKLPIAIWTASRRGIQKFLMLGVVMPIICFLTFQLVKDMGVYEMNVNTAPAEALRREAGAEEITIARLNEELVNRTGDDEAARARLALKKEERDRRIAEIRERTDKEKAELEAELKRNDAIRTEGVTLGEFQRKELADTEVRQARMIQQFNADSAQLNKELAELRARREVELPRATNWNTEEARIENNYKIRLNHYTNLKNAYDKARAEYDAANMLQRAILTEPVSPGEPPIRETNRYIKPTLLAELEEQIKTKEAELVAVNNRRRESVATVESDARRIREEFDRRADTKRADTDRKREALIAQLADRAKKTSAELDAVEQEFAAVTAKEAQILNELRPLAVVRKELDAAKEKTNELYTKRVAAIEATPVHRIATTVEIIKNLILDQKTDNTTLPPKERGDLLTHHIDMVRIWVYPVLAAIVAFLPAFIVEIAVSSIFREEPARPRHRIGFLGRRLHKLYIRAGRIKIAAAENRAREAEKRIIELAAALELAAAESTRAAKSHATELAAARAELKTHAETHAVALAAKAAETVAAKEELDRANLLANELRDNAEAEIESRVRQRHAAWSERIAELRAELDTARANAEAARVQLVRENHEKLKLVTDTAAAKVADAERRADEADLAAVQVEAKLSAELEAANHARRLAENEVKHRESVFAIRLAQAAEDTARAVEKATAEAAPQIERIRNEHTRALRQAEDELNARLRQQEHELAAGFDARLSAEKARADEASRERESELENRFEARVRDTEARWSRQVRQVEESALARLKQREQQLQSENTAILAEAKARADAERIRLESEAERRLQNQSEDAEARLRAELQNAEQAAAAKLKQREQELIARADAREAEAHARDEETRTRNEAESLAREEEWNRRADARAKAVEGAARQEARASEEKLLQKLKMREQQILAQAEARLAELNTKLAQETRRQEQEAVRQRQREEEFNHRLLAAEAAQKELARKSEADLRAARTESADALERAVKERDEARRLAADQVRKAQALEERLSEVTSFLTGWKGVQPPPGNEPRA